MRLHSDNSSKLRISDMNVADFGGIEQGASYHAAAAIRLDSQDSKALAIKHYQLAAEALLMHVRCFPDYKLNKVYMERANVYRNRIKALKTLI